MDKKAVYFPNLNGIRFIAAFLVIIHHVEQIKSILKLESYWEVNPFIDVIGKLGVVLFFVLSGFLITYLLLAEEETFSKISIRKFYIRRILRIWPLYYFIIFLSLCILPFIDFFELPGYGKEVVFNKIGIKTFLYLILFPNMVLPSMGRSPYASHTWSIGTEEQFYLIWPVILKYVKKYRILLMPAIIALYLIAFAFFSSQYSDSIPVKNVIAAYLERFTIDCMAFGGFFAFALYYKWKILKYVMNKNLFYFVLSATALLLSFGIKIPILHYEVYAVLFGIIILNFSSNKQIGFTLENPVLNYLGNISYGLYMFHPIAIVVSIKICMYFHQTSNWVLYPLSLLCTVCMAALSYHYMEQYFLRMKARFAKIVIGKES